MLRAPSSWLRLGKNLAVKRLSLFASPSIMITIECPAFKAPIDEGLSRGIDYNFMRVSLSEADLLKYLSDIPSLL